MVVIFWSVWNVLTGLVLLLYFGLSGLPMIFRSAFMTSSVTGNAIVGLPMLVIGLLSLLHADKIVRLAYNDH